MHFVSMIFLSLLAVSCAGFGHQRSYLAEMEYDDSTIFQPRTDFPVIPGDEGISWRTDELWRQRIPASEEERYQDRQQQTLKKQLKDLENAQSASARKHYERYKSFLPTDSEKIYFLSLANRRERETYLAARGVDESSQLRSSHSQPDMQDLNPAAVSPLSLGMPKQALLEHWGSPEQVDFAGDPQHENERWLYRRNGAAKYIYLESGRVAGWTSAAR
jgi:hypothetical protein